MTRLIVVLVSAVAGALLVRERRAFLCWKREVQAYRAEAKRKGWLLNYLPLTWAEYRRSLRQEDDE